MEFETESIPNPVLNPEKSVKPPICQRTFENIRNLCECLLDHQIYFFGYVFQSFKSLLDGCVDFAYIKLYCHPISFYNTVHRLSTPPSHRVC